MPSFEIPVAGKRLPFQLSHDRLEIIDRTDIPRIDNIRRVVSDALEHPLEFEAFRRALTPDDRIALVVDETLPHLSDLIAGVLDYLVSTGIAPEQVTALGPARASQDWIAELPDAYSELRTEVHQPTDRNTLAYLGTGKNDRRIYLNRTLVDADQILILGGQGYDPLCGRIGGPTALFPIYSEADTQKSVISQLSPKGPGHAQRPVAEDALETSWLMGQPFLLQVIPGRGDDIAKIVSGFVSTQQTGWQLYDQYWKCSTPRRQTVVVSLTGSPTLQTFRQMAKALWTAARAVEDGGNIVLLTEAEAELDAASELLRQCDEPVDAVKEIFRRKLPESASAFLWAWAASRAQLHVCSEMNPQIIEEMFATPITLGDVQSILNRAESLLVIPDADKVWIDRDDE